MRREEGRERVEEERERERRKEGGKEKGMMNANVDASFNEKKWFGMFTAGPGFKNHKVSSRNKLEYSRNEMKLSEAGAKDYQEMRGQRWVRGNQGLNYVEL